VLFSVIREREVNGKRKKKEAEKWRSRKKFRNSETKKLILLRAARLRRDESTYALRDSGVTSV